MIEHMLDKPMTVFVIAVIVAVLAQIIAVRSRLPTILLWLLFGMVLGPFGFYVIHVEHVQPALHTLIELGLAIVLFEGGLNLNLKSLKEYGRIIGRLVILGPLATIVIGGGAVHMLTDLDWPMAMLFGALAAIGGPTVILPLLRQTRLDRALRHILTGEAMLVDAVGAIIAIVMLQIVLSPASTFAVLLQTMVYKFFTGIGVGWLGGVMLSHALAANRLKDPELRTITTLAGAWAFYALAESLSAQAGLLAALVAGMILQKQDLPDLQRLKHFKASLSVLLVSVLFVLLAANLDLPLLTSNLGIGLLIFALLFLFARPVAAWLSCIGAGLPRRQILFLAGMAPRGVIAAAIASMFSLILVERGIAGSETLLSLVYIIIIASVLVYGLLAEPLSRWLAVTGGDNRSLLIIGGGQFGAEIGRALSETREVRFVDLNAEVVANLQRNGYTAVRGNALDPLVMAIAHAEEVQAALVMTGSSDHNLLIAKLVHDEFNVPEVYVALQEGDEDKHSRLMHQLQAKRLFGKPYHYTYWNDQAYRKRLIYELRVVEAGSGLIGNRLADARIPHGVQPMCVARSNQRLIVHDGLVFEEGDEIWMLMRPERMQEGEPLILPPASDNSHVIRAQKVAGG
ncbi:MAG: cation:proton antiporter [Mariprofundaceae bacterium]